MPRYLHSFPTRRSSDLLTWTLPYGLLIMFAVLGRFNRAYEEAATDLGATPWQRLREVVLPILLPGIIGVALFGFTLSYDEFPRSEEHTSELQSQFHLVCRAICTLSLHDALPIYSLGRCLMGSSSCSPSWGGSTEPTRRPRPIWEPRPGSDCARSSSPSCCRASSVSRFSDSPSPTTNFPDRKSTRLNSSHSSISYAALSALFPYTTLFRSTHLDAALWAPHHVRRPGAVQPSLRGGRDRSGSHALAAIARGRPPHPVAGHHRCRAFRIHPLLRRISQIGRAHV